VNEMPNTAGYKSATPCPTPSFERLRWTAGLHIPPFFKRALPQAAIRVLRELKGRILTRDFSRRTEYEQSPEDAQASASLSIVVPVHDAPTVTRRCLVSLEKYAPKAEIILVDDGSRLLETRDIIEDFVSRNRWKLAHHEKAFGHSIACGAGASLATRPYLCLLNSDTVVTPWCWRLIKETFENDQKVGVAGPSTSSSGNPQTLPVADYLRSYWNDNQICGFAKRLMADSPHPIVENLDWISGFAFFIRRALWEQLGGFDRNLLDYGNEVELCKRVAAKGYRRLWVRNAYIHHFGGKSYRHVIGDEGIYERIQAAEIYTGQKHRPLGP